MQNRLLTVIEVAQILKVNVATIYEYIRKDLIPAIKLSKSYRIDSRDLEIFINSHKV